MLARMFLAASIFATLLASRGLTEGYKIKPGFYEFVNNASGKLLDIDVSRNPAPVLVFPQSPTNTQRWLVTPSSIEGYYFIFNMQSALALDSSENGVSGAAVVVYPLYFIPPRGIPSNATQHWHFEKADDGYRITNRRQGNALAASGVEDRAGVILEAPNDQERRQKWQLKHWVVFEPDN